MNKRRFVSDEEIEKALRNSDIYSIIKSECLKYKKVLDEHQRKSAGLEALWKTLGYHVDGKGLKFTTNLYKYLHFELRRELKKQNKHLNTKRITKEFKCSTEESNIDFEDSLEYIKNSVSENVSKVVRQYCLEKRKPSEIAKINGLSINETKRLLDIGLDKIEKIWLNN